MNNIVLITSVIDPPNISLSYSKTRSVFNKEERFEQTKKTIKTIKEKLLNYDIIIVECSNLNDNELNYFKNNSKYFINFFNDTKLRKKIYSKSKSLGEGTMTIESIKFILEKNINFKNLIKISGRYWLNNNFNLEIFNNDNIICKKINGNINNINTVLYKLPYSYVKDFLSFLQNKNKEMNNCLGYEILFATYIKKYKNINYYDFLGINGNVTVCGNYYNG